MHCAKNRHGETSVVRLGWDGAHTRFSNLDVPMNSDAEKTVQRMEETLLADCRRQGLFKSGDRVIAACSGGADSMALLLFLLRHRRTLEIEVLATHVNHGIRGATARRDADFVADFCRRNGVELFLYDAVQEGIESRPTRARIGRAGCATAGSMSWPRGRRPSLPRRTRCPTRLRRYFSAWRGARVCTGWRAYRRAAAAMCGRCLCLTRADTEAYCAALGQHYIRDETNAEDVYARNRIRHDAIPALQYANPAAERSIARLCRQMRALDDWLTGEAAALLQAATVPGGYDVTVLRRAEGPVLDAALHALVSPVRDAEEKYISLLRFLVLKGEGGVQLTPQVNYKLRDGLLVCLTGEGVQRLPAPPQPFEPGEFCLPGGYFVKFQVVKYEEFLKNQPIFKKDLNCCADCAKIQGNVILRTRQPGDFFRPGGRHLRKTLKKYYNELGIPQAESGRCCRCWRTAARYCGCGAAALPRDAPPMSTPMRY